MQIIAITEGVIKPQFYVWYKGEVQQCIKMFEKAYGQLKDDDIVYTSGSNIYITGDNAIKLKHDFKNRTNKNG